MLIRIATAECFTHGKIATEIHAFSRGYPLSFNWRLVNSRYQLSLIAGLFIPTLSGVNTVLGCAPLNPVANLHDIKVYDQDQDLIMAEIMAKSVKRITGADIGIGTTAGIGKGGIAISYHDKCVKFSSECDANLLFDSYPVIQKRQQSGIIKTLEMLEKILEQEFSPGI
ncbi:FeGP cofactor biosynthesis protein HcgF family protein [Methanospirillum purgamenti]|jgi:uncharacterized protein (UPF0254 family)|uniref:FeGP cofactor biosynthesis protein HcgF family protein n=1 Tax=Methanospirillum purgamenti TaxID=2834276 RepID=UPI00211533DF|nr:FeGP cofactor biosynthesis protein HcgF family protein [Methanospirillum hungatei]